MLRSVLCHAVISGRKIYRHSIVIYDDMRPDIAPLIREFEGEVHSTEAFNGVAVILPYDFEVPAVLSNIDVVGFSAQISAIAEVCPDVHGCANTRVQFVPLT